MMNPILVSEKAPISLERKRDDSIQLWAWLNQEHFSKRTRSIYTEILKGFFAFNYDVGLKEVTHVHIRLYLKTLSLMSPSTKNLNRSALSSLFSFLFSHRYVDSNPVQTIKLEKKAETFQFLAPTFEQVQQMIELAEGTPKEHLLLFVLYYTGLRVSEAMSLQSSSFRKAEASGAFMTVVGKGAKTRVVLLPKEIWEVVSQYIDVNELDPDQYLFFSGEDKTRHLSRVQAFRIVKKWAKKAGIDPAPSPHKFRHANALDALENGAPINVVQATLGHASLSTTSVYTRARPTASSANYLKKKR